MSVFPLQSYFDCRVQPCDFEGYGRGMACMEDVAAGTELLAVPLSQCWTVAAAQRCSALAPLAPLDISDPSLLALHILVVRFLGEQAEPVRKEHMKLMESAKFETLMDWSPEDLDVLRGSKWFMVAGAMKQDIREEFAELQDTIGEFLTSYGITWESFLWAHSLVISRSMAFFEGDGSLLYLIAPGHDLFNHSRQADVSDVVQLEALEGSDEKQLVVRAYKDLRHGEQAFISYSKASSGRTLLLSGFVVPDNPFDAVELSLTFPVTEHTLPLYMRLAEALEAEVRKPGSVVVELTENEFLELHPADDPKPSEVTLHIRLSLAALGGQIERILAFVRLSNLCKMKAEVTHEDVTLSDKDPGERRRALEGLRAALESMQRGYRSTEAEDELELLQDSLPCRRRAALHVVLGEKRIFRQALQLIASKIQASS